MDALEVLSAHILIAPVSEQASVTSLRSFLTRIVELALGFAVRHQCRVRREAVGWLTSRTFGACRQTRPECRLWKARWCLAAWNRTLLVVFGD